MNMEKWENEIKKMSKEDLEKLVNSVDTLMSIPIIEKEFGGIGLTTLKYMTNSRLKEENL